MKNLKEYINESRRNFTFNKHERDALDEILGYIEKYLKKHELV